MWRVVLLALMLVAPACGGVARSYSFQVGPTEFVVQHGAEPWSDLPEAVAAMQAHPDVHPDTWDTQVILEPAGYPLPLAGPGTICYYNHQTNQIVVRVIPPADSNQPTVAGCLPHEFAHRWHRLDTPDLVPDDYHDANWRWRFDALAPYARDTWLARRAP